MTRRTNCTWSCTSMRATRTRARRSEKLMRLACRGAERRRAAPRLITVSTVLRAKARWRVSAMALAYRLRTLRLLSEWQYKSMCIELGRRGYRTGEPDGIERKVRYVVQDTFAGYGPSDETVCEVCIFHCELEGLAWGVAPPVPDAADRIARSKAQAKVSIKVHILWVCANCPWRDDPETASPCRCVPRQGSLLVQHGGRKLLRR